MIHDDISRIETKARKLNTREGYRLALAELLDLPEDEDDVPYIEDAMTRMDQARDALTKEV
jgi:hypothetical protein